MDGIEDQAPRRLSRFSDWGPDYGPELIDGYEEPAYDEPEPTPAPEAPNADGLG